MTREEAVALELEAQGRFRSRVGGVPGPYRDAIANALRRLGAETARLALGRTLTLEELAALLEAPPPPPPRPLAKARDVPPAMPPDNEGDEPLRERSARMRLWRGS